MKLLLSDTVAGHVLSVGLEVMGTGRNPKHDPQFQKDLDNLKMLAESSKLTPREKKHAAARDLCGKG